MKYIVFLSVVLLSACHQQTEKVCDTFVVPVIKKPDAEVLQKNAPPPPPPQDRAYYFGFNFIVDSTGQLYYYQRPLLHQVDGDGIDDPPPFINLQPKDLIQIPIGRIEEFMVLNILPSHERNRVVSLAALKDTFTSSGLAEIIQFLRDTANHTNWLFRKATLEERTVLDYKKRDALYDADDIHWDSTQIRFVPKRENMIKFTRPKLQD